MAIDKSVFTFLKKLEKNNDRDWFAKHKEEFNAQNKNVKEFFKELEKELSKSDDIENHKVYRIYRDVRFSKDKSPYKTKFNGYFRRATQKLRGGYFLNIEPGNSYVGGGFYGPNSSDLKRIRQEFEQDDSEIRGILNEKKFKETFGELRGESVKTSPRGFEPDHKAIDLIRMKQFYVQHNYSDKEVCSESFVNRVIEDFHVLRPYFDFMSDVLTTDLNGVSVLEH